MASTPPRDVPGLGDAVLAAAENAGLGVFVTRLSPEVRNVYVSSRAAEIIGLSVDEAMAHDPMAMVPEEAVEELTALLAAQRDGSATPTLLQTHVVDPSGERVPVELGFSTVSLEDAPASVVFVRDLRQRRKTEEDLRRSETRLRALIASAPDGIVMSREREIVYANPAAARLLGVGDPERLVGRSFAEFLHPDDYRTMGQRVATLAIGGPALGPHEYRARAEDGRALVVEVTSILFDDENGPAVVGFARDVTESRRLQAQLMRADRLAALGTMAAGVAHEINNPLAFMMLGVDAIERMLERGGSSLEQLRRMLDDVRHGVDRVAATVRHLKAFSKADGATGPSVADMAEVLEAAARMTSHEVRQYGRLELEVPDGLLPVRGDAAQLEQVFVNLLINAAHALEIKKTGTVRLGARPIGEVAVEVTVEDDGGGIAEADLAQVFDPFFTTKPVGTGTGLGLSICHSVVTELGGEITVESELGEGSVFRVRLPTMRRALTPASPARRAPPSRVESRKVVVIDDEPAFLRALERLLVPDHEVFTALDADAGLALIAQESPDAIFLDVMLPGTNGIELYERLGRERPEMASRVVFVTGGSARPSVERFLAKVKQPVLRKPFEAERVVALLRRVAG